LVELPRCENGQPHTIISLDKPPARSARKVKSGIHMFATIVGGALALVFIGLPVAIIGLFVQSLLERSNARPAVSDNGSKPIDSELIVDHVGTESKAVPSHRPNTLGRLVAPIVARHSEAAASVPAQENHGDAERQGTISDRHSVVAAASFPADSSASTCVGDRSA
jgi:hypothetical protein